MKAFIKSRSFTCPYCRGDIHFTQIEDLNISFDEDGNPQVSTSDLYNKFICFKCEQDLTKFISRSTDNIGSFIINFPVEDKYKSIKDDYIIINPFYQEV